MNGPFATRDSSNQSMLEFGRWVKKNNNITLEFPHCLLNVCDTKK